MTRILTGFGEIFLTFFFRNIILASTTAGAELWINSANGPPFKYFRWYRKWGPEHSCQEYIKEFFSEITVRDDGEAGIVWTNYAHSDEAGHKYVHKVEVRFVFINKIKTNKIVLIQSINNAGMNHNWKWPVGFTPLSGSRSMVNLQEDAETGDAATRWQSQHQLQERSVALPSIDDQLLEVTDSGSASTAEQVKENTKLSGTYYQCRVGRDATFLDRAIETATRHCHHI